MEVGAHTRTHPILSTLAPEAAREEIAGSREALARIIGSPVTAFAYPNGRPGEDYGPRERHLVEELGFDYAVATRWGVATTATDHFQLPRFTPWDRDPARWLARLLLQYRQPALDR
jgi:peptidoglycan/xylan/chitin deacetylase (PgdA/CDA1 family)